jgi:hypothetical protein
MPAAGGRPSTYEFSTTMSAAVDDRRAAVAIGGTKPLRCASREK